MDTGVDRLRANMARLLAELEAAGDDTRELTAEEDNERLRLMLLTTLSAARAAIELDDRVRALEARERPRRLTLREQTDAIQW